MILNKKHVFITPHSTIQNTFIGNKKKWYATSSDKKQNHSLWQAIHRHVQNTKTFIVGNPRPVLHMLADCQWAHSRLAVGFQGCKTLCMKLKCVKKNLFLVIKIYFVQWNLNRETSWMVVCHRERLKVDLMISFKWEKCEIKKSQQCSLKKPNYHNYIIGMFTKY